MNCHTIADFRIEFGTQAERNLGDLVHDYNYELALKLVRMYLLVCTEPTNAESTSLRQNLLTIETLLLRAH